MSAIRKIATRSLAGLGEEKLLREAVRDWRAGRAYSSGGKFYLHPLEQLSGSDYPMVGSGGKLAPWNKAVKKLIGSTSELHELGEATYGPREAKTDFERMHGMDAVKTRLLGDIVKGKPAAPIQQTLFQRPAMPPGTRSGT